LVQKNQGTPQLALELASLECIEVHHRVHSGRSVAAIQTRPTSSQATVPAEIPDRFEARLSQSSPQAQRKQDSNSTNVSQSPAKEVVQASQAQGNGDRPGLTVQQVKIAWENVTKRTRQKSSGTLAAMLRLYTILDVEGSAEQPVVVIQSEKQAHYKYVKEEERYKILEWALTIEFGLDCRVRLIPPGQTVTSPQAPNPVSYSTSTAPAVTSQQSAFLERPVASSYLGEEISEVQKSPTRMNQSLYETNQFSKDSLAKSGDVEENINAVKSREVIEENVCRDPVVQEVMKTFSARIIDIRPK
jgi:DNA polymerase-3 subunit gamma/tau